MAEDHYLSPMSDITDLPIESWAPEKLRKEAGVNRSVADEWEQDGDRDLAVFYRELASTFERLADARQG